MSLSLQRRDGRAICDILEYAVDVRNRGRAIGTRQRQGLLVLFAGRIGGEGDVVYDLEQFSHTGLPAK